MVSRVQYCNRMSSVCLCVRLQCCWIVIIEKKTSIRRSLTTDARHTLVTAFVAGRVDYCNAVLYGTSTAVTRRLQMVLNAAARLVVGIGKYEHITPVILLS